MIINFCYGDKIIYLNDKDIVVVYANNRLNISEIHNRYSYSLNCTQDVACKIIIWLNKNVKNIELRIDETNTIQFICSVEYSYDARKI